MKRIFTVVATILLCHAGVGQEFLWNIRKSYLDSLINVQVAKANQQQTTADSAMAVMNTKATPLFNQTSTKTVSGTTTETSIIGTGTGSMNIPANFLRTGRQINIKVYGVYNLPLLNLAPLTIRVKLGGVTIASATATSLLAGAANIGYEAEVAIACRSAGVGGTVVTYGNINFGTAAATRGFVDLNNGTNPTTINTTVANALEVTVQFGASVNIGNHSVSSLIVLVESIN